MESIYEVVKNKRNDGVLTRSHNVIMSWLDGWILVRVGFTCVGAYKKIS